MTRTSSGKTKDVDVIIDTQKPKVSETTIYSTSWTTDGATLNMAGSASIEDLGLAGLDPNTVKVSVVGRDVRDVKAPIISADGKNVTFKFTVGLPIKSSLTYRVQAVDENSESTYDAATVAVNISAFDTVGNGIGSQQNFEFYYPANANGLAQIALRDLPGQKTPTAPGNKTTPLPKVETAPTQPTTGKPYLPLLGTHLVGWAILIAANLEYDPSEAPPPPPPPRNPNPKPAPGPGESPSPSPNASPFVNGQEWQTRLNTPNGETLYFDAPVVTANGSKLFLDEIIVTSSNMAKNAVGRGAIRDLIRHIANVAKNQGFDSLRIRGTRVTGPSGTSAKPGATIDETIDLMRF